MNLKVRKIDNSSGNLSFFLTHAAGCGVFLTGGEELVGILDENDKLLGYAALIGENNGYFLQFFHVFPEYRGMGCGNFLLEEILHAGRKSLGSLRCELSERDPLYGFFRNKGFLLSEVAEVVSFSYEELLYSNRYRRLIAERTPSRITNLNRMKAQEKRLLEGFLADNGMPLKFGYTPSLSGAIFSARDVLGLILNLKRDKEFSISYLYVKKGHPALCLDLLRCLDEVIRKKGDTDIQICFSTNTGSAISILEYFLDGVGNMKLIDKRYVGVKDL